MATTFRLKRKSFAAPILPLLARGAAAVGKGVGTASKTIVKTAPKVMNAVEVGGAVKDGAQGLFGNSKID